MPGQKTAAKAFHTRRIPPHGTGELCYQRNADSVDYFINRAKNQIMLWKLRSLGRAKHLLLLTTKVRTL